jgi:pimeloyl-ACP methyl ester carboxylesterase
MTVLVDPTYPATHTPTHTPRQPPAHWLLLPGLMCNADFWTPLVQAAPAHVTCQVVNYGHADSITAMAQIALLSAPPSFALAGHSMGGRVALEVARLAPHRIQKLVLMDTGYLPLAPGAAGDTEATGRRALIKVAQTQGVRAMAAQWSKGMVHPNRLEDALLMQAIADMMAQQSASVFAAQQHALLTRPEGTEVLKNLAAWGLPTLLMCGRQDTWANVAQHEAMQALAPAARLTVIEDAGHMVLMEQPQATTKALADFLAVV